MVISNRFPTVTITRLQKPTPFSQVVTTSMAVFNHCQKHKALYHIRHTHMDNYLYRLLIQKETKYAVQSIHNFPSTNAPSFARHSGKHN